jgi:hypothetical protein
MNAAELARQLPIVDDEWLASEVVKTAALLENSELCPMPLVGAILREAALRLQCLDVRRLGV